METARAWSTMSPKPKRTALFLATTAEESGLLGAMYYAAHPIVPLGKTAIDFNFDMIFPDGEPESIVLNGAERTTAWKVLEEKASVPMTEKVVVQETSTTQMQTQVAETHSCGR